MTTVQEWAARRRAIAEAQLDNPEPTSRHRWQEFDEAFSPENVLKMLDVIERAANVRDDIEHQGQGPNRAAYERYTALNIGFGVLTAMDR